VTLMRRAPKGLTALVRVPLVLGLALCTTHPVLASEVSLTREGGVYVVPVQINGAITLDFVVDSGAAEVNVPADVVMTLVRAKTIAPSDFLPGATYVLADGTRVESRRFTIRLVRIGDHVVQNVPASIGEVTSQLLLGQSVLERLGRWSLDASRGVMVLGESGGGELAALPARQPQSSFAPQAVPQLAGGLPFPLGLVAKRCATGSVSRASRRSEVSGRTPQSIDSMTSCRSGSRSRICTTLARCVCDRQRQASRVGRALIRSRR
jgi:hypothetical protein